MNDSKIKVLLVEPEKYPKEIVIDDSLEAMQEVVGGDIEEYMPYDDDVAIICNADGKIERLTLNRAIRDKDGEIFEIIAGAFLIVGDDLESGEFKSLSEDDLKAYYKKFKLPEIFMMVNDRIKAIPIHEKFHDVLSN